MSNFSDFLVNALAPMIESLGAAELDPVLDDLAKSNPDDYKAAMDGAHALFNHLTPALSKSSSKFLVGLIGALEAEITSNAAKNGVTFTD